MIIFKSACLLFGHLGGESYIDVQNPLDKPLRSAYKIKSRVKLFVFSRWWNFSGPKFENECKMNSWITQNKKNKQTKETKKHSRIFFRAFQVNE